MNNETKQTEHCLVYRQLEWQMSICREWNKLLLRG